MRRVTINGLSYALPFATLLRDLTDIEYSDLESDILENGVWCSIIVGMSPTHGRIVIEGAHRARVCEKHELKCPIVDLGEVADEFAKNRCLALNVKRRHLTADELKAARSIRVQRVVESRNAGMSLRSIASKVGVSRIQVQRDLEDSGVPGGTPDEDEDDEDTYHPDAWGQLEREAADNGDYESAAKYREKRAKAEEREWGNKDELPPPPSRVIGKDGKSYPATRRPEPPDEEILTGLAPPANRVTIAEESGFERLSRALKEAHDEFVALLELNGPRLKRFLKVAKRNKVPIRNGEWSTLAAMRATVESVTLAGKPAR